MRFYPLYIIIFLQLFTVLDCLANEFIKPKYCESKSSDDEHCNVIGPCLDDKSKKEISSIANHVNEDVFKDQLYEFAIKRLIDRKAKFRKMGYDTTGKNANKVKNCFKDKNEKKLLNSFVAEEKGKVSTDENMEKLYLAEKFVNLIIDKDGLDKRVEKIKEIKRIVGTNGDMTLDENSYKAISKNYDNILLQEGKRKLITAGRKRGGEIFKSVMRINDFNKTIMAMKKSLFVPSQIKTHQKKIGAKNKKSAIRDIKRAISTVKKNINKEMQNLKDMKKSVKDLNKKLSPGGRLSINNFDPVNVVRKTMFFGKNKGAKIYNRDNISHHEVYAYSGFGKDTLSTLKGDKNGKDIMNLIKKDVMDGNRKSAIARSYLLLQNKSNGIFSGLRSDMHKHSKIIKSNINEGLELICKSKKARNYLLFNKGLVNEFINKKESVFPKKETRRIHCQLLKKVDYPNINMWVMGAGTTLLGAGAVSSVHPLMVLGGLFMAAEGGREWWNNRILRTTMDGFEESEIQQLLEITRTGDLAANMLLVDVVASLLDAKVIMQSPKAFKIIKDSLKEIKNAKTGKRKMELAVQLKKQMKELNTESVAKATKTKTAALAKEDEIAFQKKLKEIFSDPKMKKMLSDIEKDPDVIKYIKKNDYSTDEQETVYQILAIIKKNDGKKGFKNAISQLDHKKCKQCSICEF
ncbi:MAG: hypothetical protein KAQ98_12290 [Bacteriovoracaceae bacterium]|nr:hypothetical protein [Bacteriovoracaceae bacterium]